jgi:hypothetical protein
MQYIRHSLLCHGFYAVSTALVCVVTQATAQHFDIGVRVSDGVLHTDSLGTKGATPARVFPATFGDTGVARFTSNPGFDAAIGTFSAGTRVGFNALSGLRRFTGTSVEPVTVERLEVKFLTLVTLIGNDATNGFDLAVQSNGGYHRHFNFTLKANGGNLPASCIYVAEFELYTTDGVTLPSAPFFVVFNDGRSSVEHNDAIAWVESNLVETPSVCPADLDADGNVGAADLALLLASWATPTADLDGDGDTGAADLSMLLAAWGACSAR